MKIEEVECFLSRLQNEPQKVISVGFAKKNEGILIAPYMSHLLKEQIFRVLTDFVKTEIVNKKPVPYCADNIEEGNIEFVSKELVFSGTSEIDESGFGIRPSDNRKFNWNKVDYYVVRIESDKMVMKLYKWTSKIRKVRKGFLLQVNRSELERIESDFISIHNTVDFLEWKDEFLIFNHGALERILGD